MKEHIIYDSNNCEYDDYGYCSDFDDEVGNLLMMVVITMSFVRLSLE